MPGCHNQGFTVEAAQMLRPALSGKIATINLVSTPRRQR